MATRTMAGQPNAHDVAAAQQAVIQANRNFMRGSIERVAYCPVTGGSGTSATYNPGTTLFYDLPVVGSGYAIGLLITYNVNFTLNNTGTYAVNAAAPFSLFSEIKLDYGNTQIRTHPYFACKVLDMLKGYQTAAQNRVISGNNDATIAANIVGSTPIVANGSTNNQWQGKMLVRLNPLGIDSVPGVLPIMGVGNKPQLKLTCTPTFIGNDPLLHPISNPTGSSPAATFGTATVNVDVIYLDGTNMVSPAPLTMNLAGEPTCQYIWDAALTPFASGSIQRQRFITLLEHWYAVSIIIDGNQSNIFAAHSNITGFQLSPDGTGQNYFKNWNISNNVSIYDYYDRDVRRVHGQDFDPGVIVWVDAPARGLSNPDNRNGHQVLNMQPNGGFTAATHAYQVGSVTTTTTGLTPRVETFLVSMNYDGLRLA